MKTLVFVTTALVLLASCRCAKEISRQTDGLLFSNMQYLQAVDIGGFEKNYDLSKGEPEEQQYMNELLLNNLPKDKVEVLERFPSYAGYQTYYNGLKNSLSVNAMAHLSRLFLLSYVPWQQPYTTQLGGMAASHLQLLADKKFTGYALAYNTLVWLKSGSPTVAAPLTQQILGYAKKVFIPKDPSRPDSPELDNFPEMKKSLAAFGLAIEENNTALEQLRQL